MNDIIFGLRAIIEAIEAGTEIEKILLKKDMKSEIAKELFDASPVRTIRVPLPLYLL